MSKNIFVICEQKKKGIANVSLELLGQAKILAQQTNKKVCAVLLGDDIYKYAEELIAFGADIVYVVEDFNLKYYLTEQYAQAVYQVIKKYQPDIVLFGATAQGRDLAPRLAARLHTGLTADCTKLESDSDGNLYMTRPAFGGNLFATIVCPQHRPQMSTVRAGVMKKETQDFSRTGQIIKEEIKWEADKFEVELLKEVYELKKTSAIEDAKFLVSCGRGVKNNIEEVEKFATQIGANTACSRPLIDQKLMPPEKQVGQTGKTVRPSVYLALGISGAVQHLAGMEESEFIVAVNKDKQAPIFKVAHLGVVADANALLPYLQKEILKLKSK